MLVERQNGASEKIQPNQFHGRTTAKQIIHSPELGFHPWVQSRSLAFRKLIYVPTKIGVGTIGLKSSNLSLVLILYLVPTSIHSGADTNSEFASNSVMDTNFTAHKLVSHHG